MSSSTQSPNDFGSENQKNEPLDVALARSNLRELFGTRQLFKDYEHALSASLTWRKLARIALVGVSLSGVFIDLSSRQQLSLVLVSYVIVGLWTVEEISVSRKLHFIRQALSVMEQQAGINSYSTIYAEAKYPMSKASGAWIRRGNRVNGRWLEPMYWLGFVIVMLYLVPFLATR
jgi:hypothetical protein